MESTIEDESNDFLQHVDGQMLLDNIIGVSTRQSYIGDSLTFMRWCMVHEPSWVAAPMALFLTETTGTTTTRSRIRIVKQEFVMHLQHIGIQSPVMNLDKISAQGFMTYLQGLRHPKNGERLSNSSYGNKRSALFHIF